MSIWENVLFVVLGWLLGLLSSLMLDEVRRWREKRAIASGLHVELGEIRHRLVAEVFTIYSRLGEFDRGLLQWIKVNIADYKGVHASEKIRDAVEHLLRESDAQLAQLASLGKKPSGLSLKKFHLAFLDSKIDALTSFNEKFQSTVLAARAKIELLNEEIELTRFYMEKTFDASISEGNYKTVRENLETSYRSIGSQARQIVDLIRSLPPA